MHSITFRLVFVYVMPSAYGMWWDNLSVYKQALINHQVPCLPYSFFFFSLFKQPKENIAEKLLVKCIYHKQQGLGAGGKCYHHSNHLPYSLLRRAPWAREVLLTYVVRSLFFFFFWCSRIFPSGELCATPKVCMAGSKKRNNNPLFWGVSHPYLLVA